MTEIIGYIAALLTTFCYLPQAWHVLKHRNTAGISLFAYSILFCGVSLWLVYGIMIHSIPVILANALSLPFQAIIILMKIRLKQ